MRSRYVLGYVTDPGNLREGNQDSLLIRRGSRGNEEFLLLAVADGMGGMERGERASRAAVQGLSRWWEERLPPILAQGPDLDRALESLRAGLEGINRQIRRLGGDGEGRSGTTLTLVLLYGPDYRLLHVGDSRAYLLRGRQALPLTRDQTWCRREVEEGRLTEEAAVVHPKRHVLVSALGPEERFEVQTERGALGRGEALLLCSDGFYQELPPAELASWGRRSPQGALDRAVARIKAGRAEDNLTAILLRRTGGWGAWGR